MDWIKIEDTEIQDAGTQDSNSGSDPLAMVNLTGANGEVAIEGESSKRPEKRKSNMSTDELFTNIKNRRKVVKRIASGLRSELTILERRRKNIHSEFMQLKALNEYYKKLERSVLQIRQHKKAK